MRNRYHGSTFGLMQNHGGPCGVLAVVQAHILKYLLFTGPSVASTTGDAGGGAAKTTSPSSSASHATSGASSGSDGAMTQLSRWAAEGGVVVSDRELSKKDFLHRLQLSLQQSDPTSVLLQLGLSPLDRPYYLDRDDERVGLGGEGTDGSIISYVRAMHLTSIAALENWPNGIPKSGQSSSSSGDAADGSEQPAEKRGKPSPAEETEGEVASSGGEVASSGGAESSTPTDPGQAVNLPWPASVPLPLRVGPHDHPERREQALVAALRSILEQACSSGTVRIAVPLQFSASSGESGGGVTAPGSADKFGVLTIPVTETSQLESSLSALLPAFHRAGGVVLFVYSLILSRTSGVIHDDMDEPAALTAEFGHCTQVRRQHELHSILNRPRSTAFRKYKNISFQTFCSILASCGRHHDWGTGTHEFAPRRSRSQPSV